MQKTQKKIKNTKFIKQKEFSNNIKMVFSKFSKPVKNSFQKHEVNTPLYICSQKLLFFCSKCEKESKYTNFILITFNYFLRKSFIGFKYINDE